GDRASEELRVAALPARAPGLAPGLAPGELAALGGVGLGLGELLPGQRHTPRRGVRVGLGTPTGLATLRTPAQIAALGAPAQIAVHRAPAELAALFTRRARGVPAGLAGLLVSGHE